ncbi:MAG: hypothetical protein AB2556_21180, partial [Candidatus Thiodiazotropha sp.]
ACSVIGKFTQGSKVDGKRLTRRLVTDQGELDYLVRDTRLSGTWVGAPMACELGHILTYYDGSQPQFTHLRVSMLAYAHINLLSKLSRFTPDDAVRVATDSLYIRKTTLHRLDGIESYIAPRICDCEATLMCVVCMLGEPFLPPVAPAQWPDKGKKLYMPQEHAAYLAEPAFMATKRDRPPCTVPRHDNPLSRHTLSYLNGGRGSGKTTQVIKLFCQKEPLVFSPTHRLAKEMQARGAKAQTYHLFFHCSGQTEWTPERMRQMYIPRVIIWVEVCTVPPPILETFLDWLNGRGVQVVAVVTKASHL